MVAAYASADESKWMRASTCVPFLDFVTTAELENEWLSVCRVVNHLPLRVQRFSERQTRVRPCSVYRDEQ
jgi:hypothetical protein